MAQSEPGAILTADTAGRQSKVELNKIYIAPEFALPFSHECKTTKNLIKAF